jgi:hypothetical protein
MDNVKRFNKCAKQLYGDLLKMYPDETILVLANTAFKMFKNFDKAGPCQYYYNEFVSKYRKELEVRDEGFFTSGSIQFPYFAAASERLKALWNTLSVDDKEAIWDHLNVLLYLCCEVHEPKTT